MTPTPRTDAAQHEGLLRGNPIPTSVTTADFARQLERDIAELNERLIDRQETLMTVIVDLKKAVQILTRCSNASKQMSIVLCDDIRDFLKTQPSYRC